jgi:glutamate formiminotransferase
VSYIECVPNISEGRNDVAVAACADAIRSGGAALLDVSQDPTHHRAVFTFAGTRPHVIASIVALFDTAIDAIDLRRHTGAHPRIGAVDVVPFVPLGGATMDDCVEIARAVAADVAARYDLPVFLYEEAATRTGRRNLADIRRGGFAGLAAKLRDPAWQPDFGPARPHPTAGATVIGARGPLIAFNVNLATKDIALAQHIARTIRTSGGGHPALKAMAVPLDAQGLTQVSMNLTDYRQTSMRMAFDAVETLAGASGVAVAFSELIGLAPAAALTPEVAAHVRLRHFTADCVLEHRLRAAGLPDQ